MAGNFFSNAISSFGQAINAPVLFDWDTDAARKDAQTGATYDNALMGNATKRGDGSAALKSAVNTERYRQDGKIYNFGGDVIGTYEQGGNTPLDQSTDTNPLNSGSVGGGYSTNSAAYDTSADRAYLDDQEARLRGQRGSIDQTYNQGLEQLGYNYNQNVSKTNANRSRALEDFNTKRTDTERAKNSAIGRVDDNARTLADSVRRRIGLASGSGSSAFQITAPGAVARDATIDRTGVVENFGANFRDLATAEDRAKKDYDDVLNELSNQRRTAESDFRKGILDKRNSIDTSLSEIARQRALLSGGGYTQAKAAMQPFASAIDARQAEIGGLFEKYKNPYQMRDVQVQNPSLRDYIVDKTAINANQTQGEDPYSPYGQFLKKQTEEQL